MFDDSNFQEFIQRPENLGILQKEQRRQLKQSLIAKENQSAQEFRDAVLETDYEVQKALAPFLKSISLRKVIQTFVNDENGDFGKWAANPVVIQMLTQAKKLLEEGTMTEQEMQDTFSSYLQAQATSNKEDSLASAVQSPVRLTPDQLVPALNQHLGQRRKGNELFRKGDLKGALSHYEQAETIVSSISGTSQADQEEVNQNRATVLLNVAAVHMGLKQYATAADCCSRAISIQPENVKGLIRRAKCRCFMHEYQGAAHDLMEAQTLAPGHQDIEEVKAMLHKFKQQGKRSETQAYTKMFPSTRELSSASVVPGL